MAPVRWGFTFLLGTSLLDHEEKLKLVAEATVLYFKGEDRVEVRGPGYEGVLFTRHEWKVMGGFSGQQFDAEIDTDADEGKVRIRFLVSEQTFRHARSLQDPPDKHQLN